MAQNGVCRGWCDDCNRDQLKAIAALAGEVIAWPPNLSEAEAREGLRSAQEAVDNFSNGPLQRAEGLLTNRYASLPASTRVFASICAATKTSDEVCVTAVSRYGGGAAAVGECCRATGLPKTRWHRRTSC
eukprot:GHVU01098067.1.p2 GENE.GHVU01098067.1~~GHVU01098067.1.p2  ORF type:complete len:130 (+),score=15.46 GHVU01098067.1:355-744(+)